MEILKTLSNLFKSLLSAKFREEILRSELCYILCKNGKSQFIIHNLDAFEKTYNLADCGRRRLKLRI